MNKDLLRHFVHDMLLARAFEERAAQEYTNGRIRGFLHLYPGEEAVAVGVMHAAEPSDYIVSTYREHVHALVRGISARRIMAELFGKKDGVSHGMGGSMHIFDSERRFMGGYAIVGETFPIALGIGYALAYRNLPEAVICFFGDGAVNQGTFHESLNMAALWRIPVLFVCENNHYQIGTEIHRHSAVTDVHKRACGYAIPAAKADGMDVLTVYEAARQALDAIRNEGGPRLLELETYRFRGHSMADPGAYRPSAEVQAYLRDDPVEAFIRAAKTIDPTPGKHDQSPPDPDLPSPFGGRAWDTLTPAEIEGLRAEVMAVVDDAVRFAEASPAPTLDDAWRDLHCNHSHEVLIGPS
ncbi:MAG: thiamine pyrophosphate-dependent enzyme [Gammaproteobacteria bacterium]|nr:thiamine pyrophosphate-dependent enzyme [Gammaproteobacteria bacterium]